jgi:hypothetical protein
MVEDSAQKEKVVVEAAAFVGMLLHARQHKHQAVHGLLLGKCSKGGSPVTVTEAVPICHGTPVQPWIESALAMVEAHLESETQMIGWYTAPMLLDDTRPGPVALRMASILETENGAQSTLIVVQNKAAAQCFTDASQASSALQAFGKDFGNQYQESLITTLAGDTAKLCLALQKAVSSKVPSNDFLDHLEGSASTVWYPNKELAKVASQA